MSSIYPDLKRSDSSEDDVGFKNEGFESKLKYKSIHTNYCTFSLTGDSHSNTSNDNDLSDQVRLNQCVP